MTEESLEASNLLASCKQQRNKETLTQTRKDRHTWGCPLTSPCVSTITYTPRDRSAHIVYAQFCFVLFCFKEPCFSLEAVPNFYAFVPLKLMNNYDNCCCIFKHVQKSRAKKALGLQLCYNILKNSYSNWDFTGWEEVCENREWRGKQHWSGT